jgi:hypothetical protein
MTVNIAMAVIAVVDVSFGCRDGDASPLGLNFIMIIPNLFRRGFTLARVVV